MMNPRRKKHHTSLWLILLLGGLGLPGGLVAQAPPDPCSGIDIQTLDLAFIVPLDNTGIADWDYLNPRKPYSLVHPLNALEGHPTAERCYKELLKRASLTFENRTLDRAFDVRLPVTFDLPSTSARRLGDLLARLRAVAQDATVQREINSLADAIRRLEEALEELEESRRQLRDSTGSGEMLEGVPPLATVEQIEEIQSEVRQKAASRQGSQEAEAQRRVEAALEEVTAAREGYDAALRSAEQALERAKEARPREMPGEVNELLPPELRDRSYDLGRRLDEIEKIRVAYGGRAVEKEAVPMADAPIEERCRSYETLIANLAANGYTEAALNDLEECLEPLRDSLGSSPPRPVEAAYAALEEAVEAIVECFNLLATGEDGSRRLDEVCQEDRSAGILRCGPILRIQPGDTARVADHFFNLFSDPIIVFEVRFADDPEIPANSRGYLAGVLNPKEPPDTSRWTFSGAVTGVRDPDPVPDPARPKWRFFSPDHPYDGAVRRHVAGSGNLQITQRLGNRAEGSATLSFKEGDFGAAEGNLGTSVSDYKINLYSDNGLHLRFGKYNMASPQGKVAVNESGEGVELRYRWLSLGHIVSRESRARTANDQDEDRNVTIFQVSNLFSRTGAVLRGMNVLFLYGEEDARSVFADANRNGERDKDNPATVSINEEEPEFFEKYDYRTAGLETYFGSQQAKVSGSAAYYYSERELESRQPSGLLRDGSGSSFLLTASWNQVKPSRFASEVAQSFRVQVGYGTGDDPETPKDEGYLGETASFSPDKLFISRFAGNLEYEPFRFTPSGLSNKTYLGLSYTNNLMSPPLEGLASLLGIREKIVSRSTVIRLHRYRFNETILNSREIGDEVEVEFTLQVPKGVTSKLSLARFFPADSLQPLFTEEPWIATIGIQISL